MQLKNRGQSLLAGVFLLILSAYYVNSSMFYHSHEIQGETFYHSHFYSKNHSSGDSGSHTIDVIKLIASLNNFAIEEQCFVQHIEASELILESIFRVKATALAKFYVEQCQSLRAPPIL